LRWARSRISSRAAGDDFVGSAGKKPFDSGVDLAGQQLSQLRVLRIGLVLPAAARDTKKTTRRRQEHEDIRKWNIHFNFISLPVSFS